MFSGAGWTIGVAALILLAVGWAVRLRRHQRRQDSSDSATSSRLAYGAFVTLGVAVSVLTLLNSAVAKQNGTNPFPNASDSVELLREKADSLFQLKMHVDSLDERRVHDSLAAVRRQASIDTAMKGTELAYAGRIADAIHKYDVAIGLDPTNAYAYTYKGYAYFRRGNLDSAISAMEEGATLAPSDPWAYYNLSLARFEQGDAAAGRSALTSAIQLDCRFRRIVASDPQFSRVLRADAELARSLSAPCAASVGGRR